MINPNTFVIPIHYTPAMPVANWLAIEEEAKEIASFIDGGKYGPFHSGMYALHAAQHNPKPFNYFVMNPVPLGDAIIDLGSRFIVNPRVIKLMDEFMEEVVEGCVSFPHRRGVTVKRAFLVNVEYSIPDPKSKNGLRSVKKQVHNILAQVFQHECDHGNGINIYQK